MNIEISQDGRVYEISLAWVNWYVSKFLKSKKTTTQFLESASENDIQTLVNAAIENNRVYYCN